MSEYEHCIGCGKPIEVDPDEDYTDHEVVCFSCYYDHEEVFRDYPFPPTQAH